MIVLDSILKSLTVAMSGAATTTNPDFVSAWSDDTGSAFTEGSTDGALNGTTQVTLVASPAASTRRLIKTVTIQNKDTAPVTITVTLNNSGTLRNIAKVTLQVGDTWSTDGTIDTNGNLKTVIGSVNLTSGVTGVLPIANGGTNGSATPTAGAVAYGTGTAVAYTSAGTSGQALLSNGSSPPTWGTAGVSTGKSIAMALIFGF
jgi:hypothetical protein